jgi:hypothetical protein
MTVDSASKMTVWVLQLLFSVRDLQLIMDLAAAQFQELVFQVWFGVRVVRVGAYYCTILTDREPST